ncbi:MULTISPECIES: CsbD family protein [Streptomyces]|uniref:CsbD family protein n=1 Tax=Streptomyces cyaneofuscatus TaxID=66883 RepID=A0ABZ1F8L4_9ACTN|nr:MULTISPECIES: CsbD family protein [Streptomyces]MCD9901707.1 CsbD family protein [Streptomyces sp. MT29]RDV48208.1 CsbD family protein [Streptomyces sp. IB2014 011-12]WSB12516.1 CsbD family protein [Streptomyces cyaneofuscatus]WSD50793.1 CsbD family protein [Streptomyces cyaneofuscatus]WSI53109.1 CsbD family protein [Streptomyces cyaneofuscatus]
MDKLKGKGKEAVGKLTGDRRKESEGKADQAKASAKDKVDEAGDRAKGVTDSLRDDK